MKIRMVLLLALVCSLIFIAQPVFAEERPIVTADILTISDVQPFFQRIIDEETAGWRKAGELDFEMNITIYGIHQSDNSAEVFIMLSGHSIKKPKQFAARIIRFNSGKWFVLKNDMTGWGAFLTK